VGKRYLARVVAKLLYGTSAIEVFDCDRLTANSLVGTKQHEGALLETVRESPCTLLLFEHVERASRDVAEALAGLMTSGQWRPPGAEKKLSFQEVTVVLTTTEASDALEALSAADLGEAAFRARAVETLGELTSIDPQIVSAVTDISVCSRPSDRTKCEVVALLMKQECRDHGIELASVDPEIIAAQVCGLDKGDGFGLAPPRVKQFLRAPLVAASVERPPTLALRLRRPRTHL